MQLQLYQARISATALKNHGFSSRPGGGFCMLSKDLPNITNFKMEALRSSAMTSLALASESISKKLATLHEQASLPELGVPIMFAIALGIVFLLAMRKVLKRKDESKLPPAVPGFPFIGNVLQMTTAKPHEIFTRWSQEYGPIYRIKTGEVNQVIVTSPEIAKEALVTKYTSSQNRDLPSCLNMLTRERQIVAVHDYNDRYRFLKKLVMNNLLGQVPQKSFRPIRELYLTKTLESLKDELKSGSPKEVNARSYILGFLFRVGMHQHFGRQVEAVDVPELGGKVAFWKIFEIVVQDVMKGAVEIDWRDFFPSLKWIPNPNMVKSVKMKEFRRSSVTAALIKQQKELLAQKGGKADCHCDILIENSDQLSSNELLLNVWEPIIEQADTTLVTAEWTMYELSKQPLLQERLYSEIKEVAGDRVVSEDDLPKLHYLNAAIKETLRKYSPVPILPPRLVHEEVKLGGYTVPAGYQLIVNIYGVHHDSKRWKDPQVWDPSRMLNDKSIDMGISDMRLMPFGGGRRICAGITQTFYVVPLLVANLVQQFEWSLPNDIAEDVDTLYFTTQKLQPLKAIATLRK